MTSIGKPVMDANDKRVIDFNAIRQQWREAIVTRLKKCDPASERQLLILFAAASTHARSDSEEKKEFLINMMRETHPGLKHEQIADLVVAIAQRFYPQNRGSQAEFAQSILTFGVLIDDPSGRHGKTLGMVLNELNEGDMPSKVTPTAHIIKYVFDLDRNDSMEAGVRFAVEVARELFPGLVEPQKDFIDKLSRDPTLECPIVRFRALAYAEIEKQES
jgi:hypothetical protein